MDEEITVERDRSGTLDLDGLGTIDLDAPDGLGTIDLDTPDGLGTIDLGDALPLLEPQNNPNNQIAWRSFHGL